MLSCSFMLIIRCLLVETIKWFNQQKKHVKGKIQHERYEFSRCHRWCEEHKESGYKINKWTYFISNLLWNKNLRKFNSGDTNVARTPIDTSHHVSKHRGE